VAAGILFVGLLWDAQLAFDRAGCGSVDPTDPANYSEVTILNDTSGVVRLDHCVGGYCRIDRLPARLRQGQRFADDAACAVTGANMTSWRVTTSAYRKTPTPPA